MNTLNTLQKLSPLIFGLGAVYGPAPGIYPRQPTPEQSKKERQNALARAEAKRARKNAARLAAFKTTRKD